VACWAIISRASPEKPALSECVQPLLGFAPPLSCCEILGRVFSLAVNACARRLEP